MSILEAMKAAVQAVARTVTAILNALKQGVTDLADSVGLTDGSAASSLLRGAVEVAWWTVVLVGGFTFFNLATSSATAFGGAALALGGFWLLKEIAMEKPQTVLAVAS